MMSLLILPGLLKIIFFLLIKLVLRQFHIYIMHYDYFYFVSYYFPHFYQPHLPPTLPYKSLSYFHVFSLVYDSLS